MNERVAQIGLIGPATNWTMFAEWHKNILILRIILQLRGSIFCLEDKCTQNHKSLPCVSYKEKYIYIYIYVTIMCFKVNDCMSQQGSFIFFLSSGSSWFEWLLGQESTKEWGFSIKVAQKNMKEKPRATKHENPLCLEFLSTVASKTMKKLFIWILVVSSAKSNCSFIGLCRAGMEAISRGQSVFHPEAVSIDPASPPHLPNLELKVGNSQHSP